MKPDALRWCCRCVVMVVFVLVGFGVPGVSLGQNLVHKRHYHQQNPPHPTANDPERIQSSREGRYLALPVEDESFTFAVFGDRTGGPPEGVNILADAVRDVNLLEPDLVMTVGDLIQGYNDTPAWLAQKREYKGIMDKLLCPWFPVAGNHDVYYRGENRPFTEHDANYEEHFGPLWYAFKHKNCMFIALYSDEGNPETGEKTFRKPESQRMSPEQYNWLKKTLADGKDMDHIFLFLHHPRWLRGGYGDDWDRVHRMLVEAGNVTAVFAGHIHRMHYAEKDGIEYVTLATVGGGQSGKLPGLGFLHQFNMVTVRKNQIAIASLPVGQVMDVREITPKLQDQAEALMAQSLGLSGGLAVGADGRVDREMRLSYRNTSDLSIEVMLSFESEDGRWVMTPDHVHRTLKPGEVMEPTVRVRRVASDADAAFAFPVVYAQVEMLAEGYRYQLPERQVPVEVKLSDAFLSSGEMVEGAMSFDGKDDYVRLESRAMNLPDGPFTVEGWLYAESFGDRVGFLAKTNGAEYGIFVSKGRPAFSVHLDGAYKSARAERPMLRLKRWTHVAGVFDGREVRLYVDGRLVDSGEASGKRTVNHNLPLLVGADPDGGGVGMSFFDGMIDEVRLSRVARYSGERFKPERRFEDDAQTVVLLHGDREIGPWVIGSGQQTGKTIHGWTENGASVVPVGE